MQLKRMWIASLLFFGLLVAVGQGETKPYPFAKSPAEAATAANGLQTPADKVQFEPGDAEAAVIAWFQQGQLTDDQWAEAYLIASGENDAARRKPCVRQLNELTAKLRLATKGLSPRAAGEKLLKELHAGVMSKGYDLHQSSLAVLLRTGKQNCVSSTVLYQLLARRLGLQVQAVEFPGNVFHGHVLTLLIDGKDEIDVETTNSNGFDVRAKVKSSGGSAIGLENLKNGRRIDDVGLLLSLFGNRGVEAGKSGRNLDALRISLVMLQIAPTDKDMQDRVEGTYMNWVRDLGKAQQFERSIAIGRTGLELMPKSTNLHNNVKAIHQQYATHLIATGKDAQIVELYTAAHQQWPQEGYQKGAANAFTNVAHETRREKGWDAALAVVARGLKELPRNADLLEFVCYAAQRNLDELDTKQGPPAAMAWFQKTQLQFPEAKKLPEVAEVHVARTFKNFVSKKEFDEARASIAVRAALITAEKADYFSGAIYDEEARELVERKEWAQASEVYLTGLAQYPKHELLTNNAPSVFTRQAKEQLDGKNWQAAIQIYNQGLKSFPGNSLFQQNIKYCEAKLKGN